MSEPTAFPLDESKLPFKIPKDTKPREKIMKLGQMITDRVPAKLRRLTVEDPEYWGLASIVTDEMADVALKMKVRQPMTLPELEKATGKPAKELEPLLYRRCCGRADHFACRIQKGDKILRTDVSKKISRKEPAFCDKIKKKIKFWSIKTGGKNDGEINRLFY